MEIAEPKTAMTPISVGVEKQLLAEELFQRIGETIIDGTLEPGQRIRDADLAAQYSVSRMPVREALQRLERLGLVEMRPSRFTRVTEVNDETVAQSLEFAGYQAGVLTRMAVLRMSDAQRASAAALAESVADALVERSDVVAARWALFGYLADHCGNPLHTMLLSETGMVLTRNLRGWSLGDDGRAQVADGYRRYAEAIRIGDADGAERQARTVHLVD
ncbi:GntR family transcriptional regulator [Streptomyces sp. MS2A]|uniref:GntR family transcriptional regulator n=1 Tax=Microbacterium resistens TaxID=156977 RepID=UPI000B0F71BF|nr:GntR family transcriptional regulator [Microbacterium resistens]MDA4894276.1 GntR family transcriptional regulator [Streptomyces sp. MS2A]